MTYYYTDGRERFGPFTLEELREKNIARETLIWRAGLTDWMPAGNLAELQPLFQPLYAEGANPNPTFEQRSYPNPPKNWLTESILITILCCFPFGLVGIILSAKMETLWKMGEYKAAQMLSDEAGRWVKIGVASGVVLWILFILYWWVMVKMIGDMGQSI